MDFSSEMSTTFIHLRSTFSEWFHFNIDLRYLWCDNGYQNPIIFSLEWGTAPIETEISPCGVFQVVTLSLKTENQQIS